eukprot:6811236-Pyramimonas_sp.AAC.1
MRATRARRWRTPSATNIELFKHIRTIKEQLIGFQPEICHYFCMPARALPYHHLRQRLRITAVTVIVNRRQCRNYHSITITTDTWPPSSS